MNRYQNKNASKTISVDVGPGQSNQSAPFTPFSITSGTKKDRDRNMKKYHKMMGTSKGSQGPTTIDSSQNGHRLLADAVFNSQMNSINQYKTKIFSRHQRMLSTTIQRDENYERMHTINSQNPFQARHSLKTTQGELISNEDKKYQMMRISSKLTSQNATRETMDHPNIQKEQPVSSIQDEFIETMELNGGIISAPSRQFQGRDKFKTIDHSELPQIQTPALSSDLREGYSMLPASQMGSDPQMAQDPQLGSDAQMQILTYPSMNIDLDINNGTQSQKTQDHNRTGQFGNKSLNFASDFQIEHENLQQHSSGLHGKFQRVPTFQAIKANPSGDIESSSKVLPQNQTRLSFDKSAMHGADFRQSTILQGSLSNTMNFTKSSKNNEKLQQIITSTQRHISVANQIKSQQQLNSSSNYRSVNNRLQSRSKKHGAAQKGLSIDMYNNKISNFNDFKKNFPRGLVDKKNSTLVAQHKDQSVGQTESVPPSMQHNSHFGQPQGTGRYGANGTDHTQSDDPLLQIYQKDQYLKSNNVLLPKFNQQNQGFQNIMQPIRFEQNVEKNQMFLHVGQNQFNQIQQMVQGFQNENEINEALDTIPLQTSILNYQDGVNKSQNSSQIAVQHQKIPTEFQALIDKQRQFELNQEQRNNQPTLDSGLDTNKTNMRVISPDQRQMMRFSMGQASIESPHTDISRSGMSKQEPLQMGLSSCDGETQSPNIRQLQALRESNNVPITPQDTENKAVSRYSQQQIGDKSRLSQEFDVLSPIPRQPIQGVDIKVGDAMMNQHSNNFIPQFENLMNQSMPTTKEIEQSSKQILVHKSATSIALQGGHRVDISRKLGHSAYDYSNQRNKETQNLYLNEDDDSQTRNIGSHNVSKNDNFKVLRNFKSNLTPLNNQIQIQREAQVIAQKSQLNFKNTREGSASERQSAPQAQAQNLEQPSKRLTTNDGTASSLPLKIDPSQTPQRPNLDQITMLGDQNLMGQTYDTNMRSSLMQINSTKKILPGLENNLNQSKRSNQSDIVPLNTNCKEDADKTHQIIKEMKNMEEEFADKIVQKPQIEEEYDPILAQEASELKYQKQFRGTRLMANRVKKYQHKQQHGKSTSKVAVSHLQDQFKIKVSTIVSRDRKINVLNSGNAGFFQSSKPKNQGNSGFSSSFNTFINDQTEIKKKKKLVTKKRNQSRYAAQNFEIKNEINNLNIGNMETEDQVQKVVSMRDLLLKESNIQSKTSLLAKSQRTRKNRNPRHSAGPIKRGIVPVQKKLAIDYAPIDTTRKGHQACGHQFQYYNVGGGGKYSSMRHSFESRSKSKSRYRSRSPKKTLRDDIEIMNEQPSPTSNQVRSTFRKARIDGNRISPGAERNKSRTQSPSYGENEHFLNTAKMMADEQFRDYGHGEKSGQKSKKLRLFEVGSQDTNSQVSFPMPQQENSRGESDDSHASPLVLKNARMKSFGTTTIKPNEINQINKEVAVSSFNQTNKKSCQELKLDISSTKIKRQSLNINDIIQGDPDAITPKNNEQGAGTPKSFTMGLSRNKIVQKKSTGQIHQSQRGSRSEGGKFGFLQDTNRPGHRNSVTSKLDKKESTKSQPMQVFKMQQTNSGHIYPGLSGGADANRQQTSHHLKIKIGDENESQLHTTTQIPTILAAVQSRSGSKGSMGVGGSKDGLFFQMNQNVMGQNQRMFINHIVNASQQNFTNASQPNFKNFMNLPVQNLVFTGEKDHRVLEREKQVMMMQYYAGQQGARDSWKQKLDRPLTPDVEPSTDYNEFRDFRLMSSEMRKRHKSQGKFTLKSRVTQVAQNNRTLADLCRGPLELDSKLLKVNQTNHNFDKIALETKDRTLMRLAIERKKSLAQKEKLFPKSNKDLEMIEGPSSQFPLGATSMEQSMGTRHSVIIIQLGDKGKDLQLGCLEVGAGPTLQGTINEELGELAALSQATQSGQLSPSDITKVTAKPRLGKRNSSLVSGSWALPAGMVHGNIQGLIQNADLPIKIMGF